MKNAFATLHKAQKLGAKFHRNGQSIQYSGPHNSIGPRDIENLASNKDEILLYLAARDHSASLLPMEKGVQPMPSLIQEMWWSWIDHSISLVVPVVCEFHHVSPSAVEHAIRLLVKRHTALRSRFSETGSGLSVQINNACDLVVEHETLCSVGGVQDCVQEFMARPLLQTNTWLTAAKIISCGPQCTAVLISNHLVADGRSSVVLTQELNDLVHSPNADEKAAPQHSDFAVWQRQWFSHAKPPLVEFWRHWSSTRRNAHSPRGSRLRWAEGVKAAYPLSFPPTVLSGVVGIAHSFNTSEFVVCLTGFAIALSNWAGWRSFPVRSIYDERTSLALRPMVGLMTGADAIEIALDKSQGVADHLRMVEAAYLYAMEARLPTMYAYPPFVAGGLAKPAQYDENIGIVINYMDCSHMAAPVPSASTWEPPVEAASRRIWPHPVSAIALELCRWKDGLSGKLLLHDGFISPEEQPAMINALYASFREMFDKP